MRDYLIRRLSREMSAVVLIVSMTACSSNEPIRNGDITTPPPPSGDLLVCPRITVSNAPPHNTATRRLNRSPLSACINGRLINLTPAQNACMSSGYGSRGGKRHRGIDYQARPAGDVVAAADGTVVFRGTRSQDFGNVIYLDHGNNVYTGYAHLANFAPDVQPGQLIKAGERLGRMGSTGAAAQAIHLHFEIRTGSFNRSQSSSWFGLESVDPFRRPARCALP